MRIFVRARHRVSGFHRWPNAPQLNPTRAYLADRHRHLFHLTVTMEVDHPDRSIEFHDLQSFLAKCWEDGHEFHSASCEQIGRTLTGWLIAEFGNRRITVEVDEDGENGAIIEHDPWED